MKEFPNTLWVTIGKDQDGFYFHVAHQSPEDAAAATTNTAMKGGKVKIAKYELTSEHVLRTRVEIE